MDTLSTSPPIRKPLALRNLQPRSAAAVNFTDGFSDNDDDDLDNLGGASYLSADYKAQRRTTQELVDFFKSAPPPSPPRDLLPIAEEKKKTLLQRLRSRKLSATGPGGRLGVPGTSSSMDGTIPGTGAGGKGTEVATLPNGKKYVMIAVDYQEKDAVSASTQSGLRKPGGGSDAGSKRESLLSQNPSIQITPDHGHYGHANGNNLVHYPQQGGGGVVVNTNGGFNIGGDRRRSIIIQAGGGEGASFILDNTPFLLDNFALDTDFIMTGTNPDSIDGQQHPGHRRTGSSKSGQSQDVNGGINKKGGNKVKFNMPGEPVPAMDDDALTKALNDRMANHRAQLAQHPEMATENDGPDDGGDKAEIPPEVTLPKPVARKRVRHVQIQTQHCVMRPMFTQTEPLESMVHDLEVKEFSCPTDSDASSMMVSTTTTSTKDSSTLTIATTTPGSLSADLDRANNKVASLVASLSKPTYASTSTSTSPVTSPTSPRNGVAEAGSLAIMSSTTTMTTTTTAIAATGSLSLNEAEELAQLRQQNASLQTEVAHLKRDLASEIRARTRTAVAMQDTRDKFEMLSAMAYKKLKEMIFQRHILEMEVRELRVKVDMLTEEGDLYHPQQNGQHHNGHHHQQNGHHLHHGHQEYVSTGRH